MTTAASPAVSYGTPAYGPGRHDAGLVSVDGRTYPLREARIRAMADNGYAESVLEQVYDNPFDEPLEVQYTLPLPADGAVVGYTVTVGETVIRGEIHTRAAARESFRKALIEGRTAGLLEQERADTFTQSLGSIPAQTPVRVEIRIAHPLAFAPAGDSRDAVWEYRFPTVVGVRYMGEKGRVPDADKLSPDRADDSGTPARLAVDLEIAGEAVLDADSPSHELVLECEDGQSWLRTVPAPLDRDVVIRWAAGKTDVGVRLIDGGGLEGDDGRYGLLTVTPPARPGRGRPRDVSLLIDASGSMRGAPLDSARELAIRVLETLDERDRFDVSAFSTDVQELAATGTRASRTNVGRAVRALRELTAGGGTEMAHAIETAMARDSTESGQRQIVLLTDGYIGFEEEVIRRAHAAPNAGVQIHTVGVGSAPNRTLLRGLSRAGRGAELFVGSPDDIDAAAETLLRATCAPVLTDVTLTGTALAESPPGVLVDVMAGQPLRAALRLAPEGGELVVGGRLDGRRATWRSVVSVAPHEGAERGEDASAEAPRSALPLGALYGRDSAEALEARRAIAAEPSEVGRIDAEIERVGLAHRVVTRCTSMIAVAEEPTVDPREPRRRVKLAVEMPAEVSAEGVGLRMTRGAHAFAPMVNHLTAEEPMLARSIGSSTEHYAAPTVLRDRTVRFRRAAAKKEERPTPPLDIPAFLRRSARPGRPAPSVNANVLVCDGPTLLVEFEVPAGGFDLGRYAGDAGVQVLSVDGAKLGIAHIDSDQSSPLGNCSEGVTVRIALVLETPGEWPAAPLVIALESPGGKRIDLVIDSLEPAGA